MRRDTFAEILGRFNSAQPFLPFTVELINRVRLVSTHPEAIIFWRGDLVVWVETEDTNQYFDATSVARVVSVAIPHGAE